MENSSTLISEEIENVEETTEETTEETEVEESPVEETTEEQPQGKFYTDEEFNQKVNEIADRRVARKMRKVNHEIDSYKDTINVLKSQIGGESPEEVNAKVRELYEKEGVELPKKIVSEDTDYIKYQADRDCEDIESEGYEKVKEEANRLAEIGYDNLSSKDKILFTKLCESLNKSDDIKVLNSLNVDASLLEDKDFKEFRAQFNRNVPISKIYDMYSGKKETKINTPGNLENKSTAERDYFTDEEIEAMSEEELEKNWDKVRYSQTRGYLK